MKADPTRGDESVLRRYLLGELSETVQSEVEERLFSEDERFERLSFIEDELIDAYVQGDLSAGERQHFESNFLSSPRRRARLRVARLLLVKADSDKAREAWFARFRLRLSSFEPLVATAALIVAVFLCGWLIRVNDQLAQERSKQVELSTIISGLRAKVDSQNENEQRLVRAVAEASKQLQDRRGSVSAALPPLATLSFILSPFVERRVGEEEQKLLIPSGGHAMLLQLDLTTRKPYASYRIVIQDFDGNQIWSKSRIPATPPPANVVNLNVPSGVLGPGNYRIMVSGVSASGEIEELQDYYAFRVVAR